MVSYSGFCLLRVVRFTIENVARLPAGDFKKKLTVSCFLRGVLLIHSSEIYKATETLTIISNGE
jgi:hypothetical protein